MKEWSIRQRLIGSFALILLLMLVMGGIAYTRLAKVGSAVNSLQTDSLPGLYYSAQLMVALETNYAVTEAHVLEDDKAGMDAQLARLMANAAELDG